MPPPIIPFQKVFLITHCIVWSNLVACILFSPRTIPHLFLTLLQAKPFQHSGSSIIVLKEVWDCSLFDATIFGGVKIQDPIYVQFDKYFAPAMASMNNLTRGLDMLGHRPIVDQAVFISLSFCTNTCPAS